MKKAIIGLALLASGCAGSPGLMAGFPNPEDPKYNSPSCRAARELAQDLDYGASSRTGLAMATQTFDKRIKDVPSTKHAAAYQENRAMARTGVRDLCSS